MNSKCTTFGNQVMGKKELSRKQSGTLKIHIIGELHGSFL